MMLLALHSLILHPHNQFKCLMFEISSCFGAPYLDGLVLCEKLEKVVIRDHMYLAERDFVAFSSCLNLKYLDLIKALILAIPKNHIIKSFDDALLL